MPQRIPSSTAGWSLVGRRRRPGHCRNYRADSGVAVAAMREENSTDLAGLRRDRPGRPGPSRRPARAWRPRTRWIQPRPAGCETLHAHLPAAAPGPAPDARPAGLSADRGWGGRPGKGAGPRPPAACRSGSPAWQPDRPAGPRRPAAPGWAQGGRVDLVGVGAEVRPVGQRLPPADSAGGRVGAHQPPGQPYRLGPRDVSRPTSWSTRRLISS